MGQLRLGVDIGGTFTDLLLADDSGVIMTLKTPSVPRAPEQAVLNGLDDLVQKGINLKDINVFIHGTTLAVNTLIERKGCKTALLVTRGFRDILEMRRLRLEDTIDLYSDKVLPLVPREYVVEIDERITADGAVYQDLSLDGLDQVLANFLEEGVESIAVSLMHSYKNPVHEQMVKAYIQEKFPQFYISISSEIWPQQKEYERTLVTVINSYVGKKMTVYFESLIQGCQKKGLQASVLSTMSNGGIMTAESAAMEPVRTLLSGPASGVIGAAQIAKQVGVEKIITFDMGGTSADIAVIDGTANYSTENKVGDFPVIIPAVDVTAIGAGGGSIAWIDDAGVLKVGPESAGAVPGPVAYNRGGTRPTLTDAYTCLKFLEKFQLLDGEMEIFPDKAADALKQCGEPLGLDVLETAQSIIDVATANMYAHFIPLMAKNGVDAREYALLAYGGAGPLHAFILAREVGIRKIIVPTTPGTLCALGSAFADLKQDYVFTTYKRVDDFAPGELTAVIAKLKKEGYDWIEREAKSGIKLVDLKYEYSFDMRFAGQAFELKVMIDEDMFENKDAILNRFCELYKTLFGVVMQNAKVEIINVRVTAIGVTEKGGLDINTKRKAGAGAEKRQIYFDHKYQQADVMPRFSLKPDEIHSGPAILTAYDTTIFIPAEFNYYSDKCGNIIGEMRDE